MRTTALVLVAPTLVLYNGKGLELKPPVYCDAVVNAKKGTWRFNRFAPPVPIPRRPVAHAVRAI